MEREKKHRNSNEGESRPWKNRHFPKRKANRRWPRFSVNWNEKQGDRESERGEGVIKNVQGTCCWSWILHCSPGQYLPGFLSCSPVTCLLTWSPCVTVFLCLCVSFSACAFLYTSTTSVCLWVCLSTRLFVSVFLFVFMSVWLTSIIIIYTSVCQFQHDFRRVNEMQSDEERIIKVNKYIFPVHYCPQFV